MPSSNYLIPNILAFAKVTAGRRCNTCSAVAESNHKSREATGHAKSKLIAANFNAEALSLCKAELGLLTDALEILTMGRLARHTAAGHDCNVAAARVAVSLLGVDGRVAARGGDNHTLATIKCDA